MVVLEMLRNLTGGSSFAWSDGVRLTETGLLMEDLLENFKENILAKVSF